MILILIGLLGMTNNANNNNTIYIGTYKVVKLYRKSGRRQVLLRNLSLEVAKIIVKRYPSSNSHMVVFMKQFWSDKWFINKKENIYE